jgi:hypothetical protein
LKKFLYFGIMIVALLLVIELISRAYYYQRLSTHQVAAIQLLKDTRDLFRPHPSADSVTKRLRDDQYRVRPGSSRAENDEIVRENTAANQTVYEPWVGFAFRDIRSRYVNVNDHIRVSLPDRSDSLGKDPLRIFFLGGSTTYGYNVTDSETIPSSFVRAYHRKYPQGRPIRVFNLGMPFYFSYQELIQLSDKLFRDEKPDMVIMLDGLNDCIQATASYTRAPVFVPGLTDLIPLGSAEARSLQANYTVLPTGMDPDSACMLVYRRYMDNIRHAREIASLYDIPLYCFWQPVPYYNYPNRPNDPNCAQNHNDRFEKIYPLVKKSAGGIPYLFFLGDMLQEEKGLPFVDQIHYSPLFNQTIAEKMLSEIVFH